MKFEKILALVLVFVLCLGMITACAGDETAPTTKPCATKPSTTAPKEAVDVVGVVTEISSTFIALDLCQDAFQGLGYKKLDTANLEGTGKIDYVYLNSSALFAHYTDGELKDLKKADLKVGDIVVVTKTAKGIQQIVIMNYKVEAPTEPTTPSEGK